MRAAQAAGGRPSPSFIRGCLDGQRLVLCGEHRVKLKLRIDDDIRAVDFKYRLGFTADRDAVFEEARRPAPLILLAVRSVRGLDLIFRDLPRKFLPRPARRFVRQVESAGRLRLEVADQSLPRPQLKTHAMTLRRPQGHSMS